MANAIAELRALREGADRDAARVRELAIPLLAQHARSLGEEGASPPTAHPDDRCRAEHTSAPPRLPVAQEATSSYPRADARPHVLPRFPSHNPEGLRK